VYLHKQPFRSVKSELRSRWEYMFAFAFVEGGRVARMGFGKRTKDADLWSGAVDIRMERNLQWACEVTRVLFFPHFTDRVPIMKETAIDMGAELRAQATLDWSSTQYRQHPRQCGDPSKGRFLCWARSVLGSGVGIGGEFRILATLATANLSSQAQGRGSTHCLLTSGFHCGFASKLL
jgi:hypothetical protein